MAFWTTKRSAPASGGGRQPVKHGVIKLILLVVAVALIVLVVPIPWAVHIGGRFTPTESWDGYGQVTASNGGRYVLFTHLHGGIIHGRSESCSFEGCDNMDGTARLCTESGQTYSFSLSGGVSGWLSTDNAATRVDLAGGTPVPLPSGWVVALRGRWHGPALELSSPDNSFTKVFTRRGAIRTTTSSADAGTAKVTIRYGSASDFAKSCHALAQAS
jgi:hypothetical protein